MVEIWSRFGLWKEEGKKEKIRNGSKRLEVCCHENHLMIGIRVERLQVKKKLYECISHVYRFHLIWTPNSKLRGNKVWHCSIVCD